MRLLEPPEIPALGAPLFFRVPFPFPHQFRLLALRKAVVHIIAVRLSKQWWPVPHE
jgi:hypothetical protein